MQSLPDGSTLVPEHAPDVHVERDIGGTVTVSRKRFTGLKAAMAKPMGIGPDRSMHLDPIATAVWDAIDGRTTVGQIRAQLADAFPEEQELGLRLGKLMGVLASQHLIVLRTHAGGSVVA